MGKLRHLEGSGLGLPPVSQLWSQSQSWDRAFQLDLSLGAGPCLHPPGIPGTTGAQRASFPPPLWWAAGRVGRGLRSLEKGEKRVGSSQNMGAQVCFIFKAG